MNNKKSLKVPLAHKDKGEMNKRLLISIITFVLIGLLVLFILYGKTFVGKAITTGDLGTLTLGSAGILIGADSFVSPEDVFTLPVWVNLPETAYVFSLTFSYDTNNILFEDYFLPQDIVILDSQSMGYDDGTEETTLIGMISPNIEFSGINNLMNLTFNALTVYQSVNIEIKEFIMLNANNISLITIFSDANFLIKISSEDCSNLGVDEDVDGLSDCDDSDCINHPFCLENNPDNCIDTIDNDKDGNIDCEDEECINLDGGSLYAADSDGDGFINPLETLSRLCGVPLGYSLYNQLPSDCDDLNAGVHFGAAEICSNNIDENCNGQDEVCAEPPVVECTGDYSLCSEQQFCLGGRCQLITGVDPNSGSDYCANDVDDDNNGLVDCADSDCANNINCALVPAGQECNVDAQCTDNLECTNNVCLNGACTYVVAEGQCFIEDVCYQNLAANPENSCQVCQALWGLNYQTNWGYFDDNVCDDGDSCTERDYCQAGRCVYESTCTPEICNNGIDDNENGDVDCVDTDCMRDAACGYPEFSCIDGIDNNRNGLTDCEESACINNLNCDADTDAILNAQDNCLYQINPAQEDHDFDERGDVCDDSPCGSNAFLVSNECVCNGGYENSDTIWSNGCEPIIEVPLAEVVLGDVTGDNIVNTGDAIQILRYSVGLRTFTAEELNKADVTCDNTVNTGDAIQVLRYSVGLRETLSCP